MNNITIDIKSVKHLSKAKRKSLNFLIQLSNKHNKVYPTQEKISQVAACTSEWVSKMTSEWHLNGWLIKTYRHMTSCVYELSPFWFDFNNRQELKDILPALAWIPISVGMLINTELTKSSNDTYMNISYNSFEERSLEKVMSVVVKKVVEKYGMNGYQQEQLKNYTDSVISEADRITSKSTVSDPVAYFFGICRKKHANTSSFKPNHSTASFTHNVSDNNNRKLTQQSAQSPIYNEFVSEVKSADERKELRLIGKEKQRKQDEYIKSVSKMYGENGCEFKKTIGLISLAQIIKQTTTLLDINQITDEDDGWWLIQKPMDIEDYDNL